MKTERGIITLNKFNFEGNEYAISFAMPFSCGYDGDGNWYSISTNLDTDEFRLFKDKCVGNPDLILYANKSMRDERYEEGKQILISAGYKVIDGLTQ